MTDLPPPGTPPEPEVIPEREPTLAPIVRRPKDHSRSGSWLMGLGVFLLGVTAVLAVLVTIPGLRDNGDAVSATRDELACRAVSQAGLETARAELQRGQAQWAEALGVFLISSEVVLRNVLAGPVVAADSEALVAARAQLEEANVRLDSLDAPLAAAIAARDLGIIECDPHGIGTETP